MGLTQITTGGVDDNINIDSNTLKVDGTNNRVGIGTATPNFALDVNGNIALTEGQVLAWHDGSGNKAGDIYMDSSDNIVFRQTSSVNERMRIASSGTTSITSNVAVNGSELGSRTLQLQDSGTDDAMIYGDNSGSLSIQGGASQPGAGITLMGRSASSDPATIKFYTEDVSNNLSSFERMRIDSSGNVGIGETSIDRRLHVRKDGAAAAKFGGEGGGGDYAIEIGQLSATSSPGFNATGGGSMLFKMGGTEAIRINSSGNVGIGTTSASDDIHLKRTGSDAIIRIENTGNGNHSGIFFVREASSGTSKGAANIHVESNTGGTGTALIFGCGSNTSATGGERMRITSNTDGQLLLGTTSGSNSSGTGVKLKGGSSSSVDVVINAAQNINLNHVYNLNATNNGYRFYIQANGGIVNHSGNNTNLSDEREKKNIADMDSAWSDLKQWVLREFHFNDEDDSEPKHYGVIAQQVETVSPEVISDFQKDETTTRKGVKEMQMMWMAIKALQEAQARIETLETKVAALEAAE